MDPQTNRVGLQMMPGFVLTGHPDAKLKIALHNVLTITPTEDSVKNTYLSNTTGLLMPSSGSSLVL